MGGALTPPLDLSRPLWQIWVIEGLEGGRVAMLTKLHHSLVDGIRGLQIQPVMYDLTPDAPMFRPGREADAGTDGPGPLALLGGAAVRLAGLPCALRTARHLARARVSWPSRRRVGRQPAWRCR